MAQQSPEGCNAAFAWLTELLALDIHSLRQVSARRPGTDTEGHVKIRSDPDDVSQLQSGAVYLMALDAFHNGAVTIEKASCH